MRTKVIVRTSVLARLQLSLDEARERFLCKDATRQPQAVQERRHVVTAGIREVSRVDGRQYLGVR